RASFFMLCSRSLLDPHSFPTRRSSDLENARPEDLPVNPCKAKHLTNMRSQGEGKGIQLEAPLSMSLERAIEYIDIDEYVEATPKSLRLRKRILDATARKRAMVIAA